MITYGSTTLTSYNSIVKTEVYYYKSTSATSLSGGSWATTKPTWENGKYIWQKIRTIYEDETHTESDPVNITGQQGATGTAAYSYKLNSSDSIIGKTKDGEYTIKKITFSATYKQGTGAVSAYNGRFKIESTTNGSTWKTEYTSSGNETSKEFTIPDDIIAIRCLLYQSDGTTVLLDIVTVPVVKDGVDAIGLRDSIPYYLASDKDTGITKLTQGWTRYKPELTAEKKYLWVYYVSRYSEGTTEPELIEIKDDVVHFVNNGDESPVESCVVDIEPVQAGSGDPSPDNVRPITGWTGAKVTRTGKNLLSNMVNSVSINGITFTVNEDRSITVNGTATARANLFYSGALYLPPADYYLSIGKTFATEQCFLEVKLYKAATGSTRYIRNGSPFTVEKGDYIQEIYFSVFEGKTVNDTIYPQIELGSTATAYEPYSGQTYDITFQSEAGTVYGGQLNVTTGELVVDRAIWTGNTADMNNNEDYPGWWNAGIKDIVGSGVNKGVNNAISNVSPTLTSKHYAIGVNTNSSSNTGVLWLNKNYFNKNQTEWKALALDVQIVLPLATPITYTLTPQEITMLCKENNIFADTGQTAISYYNNQTSTDPYVDYSLTSAFDASTTALDKAKEVAQDLADLGADLQAQIDGKIETYYQSTNPASAWTTADIRATHDGDLWYYTGTITSTYTKDNVYRYNASNNTWTTYSASGDLFDKVDGKTTVFYGKTTDTFADVETGDYLVDATDGSSYRYDGSKWVKVTDYQAAIDSMSIGGRNLFVTASRFHPEENAFTTTSTGKDNHIENFDAKGGIYTVEPFKAGDVITLQAQSNLPWNNRHTRDGTAPNTVGFWIQAYDTMEDARARRNLKRSQFLTNDLGENHTSFLHTFTVPQDDNGRYYNFRFNSYSDGTQSVTAKFWDLQLERGNKATSWSPALEDLQVNIEGAEKRNLLLNTQKKTYSSYTMYYDLSESGRQLQEGEVVTFSMKATVPVDRKRWAIYNSGGYLAISQWEAIEPDGETAVIYTWTGVWKLYYNDDPVANDKLHVYIGTAGANSSVTVEWAKLERGNTMSAYSPAPEDIDSSISIAQTTADEALAATQPISSKTFIDIIGTANDIANASFYFAKVHPTTYTDPWMVKMKIKASVPSDANFRKTVDITIHGCRSNFISYDSIVANYNSNPIYYLNLYRATQAGIETNKKGHALGFGLRSSTSPTDTNKKRTFEVDLLEVDGCIVDWIDTPVKYADMDGTGSTNYVGCTELGITSNGQNATNNGNTYDRIKYSTIKAAEAIARYNIIVGTSAGYKHLKSGTPWDITYPILYADAALNANATGASNYLTIPFTVTTTQNMTLTPYKPVYIEGTLEGTTFTPIDTTPLTQTVPTSDNGHQYILLGSAYSTTAINLEAEHPIYQFQNGNFVTVAEAASRIGANAENLIKATYAVCSTAAGINAKTADCTNFELYEGARIQVTFTNTNTASAPTLNINNTGAKAIYINKTAASNTNQLLWTAGSKMEFVYDGTGWIAQNVPYALYGTCSTGASTAAKAVTCNEAVICKGTTISVNMTNTNTAANATMNVGSTLPIDIYANGAKLTTNSRFNWRANTTQKFVFDGQVWRMDDDSVKALATAYITEIDDDGIMVHPEDDSTSGWAISDAIQLFKSGISYIKLWIENNIPKIRIGKEDQGHIILDNDSVDIRNDDKVLASFGATSVIGDENDWHQTIAANQITFAKGNDTITYISPDKLYTINAEVADAFYISNYSIRNASDGKLVIGLRR